MQAISSKTCGRSVNQSRYKIRQNKVLFRTEELKRKAVLLYSPNKYPNKQRVVKEYITERNQNYGPTVSEIKLSMAKLKSQSAKFRYELKHSNK
jgi:hypothetical protein